jgi:hypothetical protein
MNKPQIIDNLIVSPDISTLSTATCIDFITESGSFWIEEATDCVLSATGLLVSDVSRVILIRAHKYRAANKAIPP